MRQGRFRLHIRKNLIMEGMTMHWNLLPRQAVESSSLKVFKRCADMALRNKV